MIRVTSVIVVGMTSARNVPVGLSSTIGRLLFRTLAYENMGNAMTPLFSPRFRLLGLGLLLALTVAPATHGQTPSSYYTLAPCRIVDTRDPNGPTFGQLYALVFPLANNPLG